MLIHHGDVVVWYNIITNTDQLMLGVSTPSFEEALEYLKYYKSRYSSVYPEFDFRIIALA